MELDDYLQHSLGEAHYADSGHFTLDPNKALARLAHFALPRATDWVLKLVQAAVASHAPELSIHLHLTRVSAEFHPQPTPTRQALIDAVCDPEPSGQAALDHLRLALWDCFRCQRPFRLETEALNLQFDGRWLQTVPLARKLSGVHLSVSLGKRGEWLAIHPEVRASLGSALRRSAALCPIPLTLDSQRLDGLDLALDPPDSIPLALIGTEGDQLPLSPRSQLERLVPPSQRFSLPHPQQVESACLLSYHLGRERRSLLHFVHHGIVIESTWLPLPLQHLSADVFCSGDGMRTDVSGLSLVHSREWEHLCADLPRRLQPRISQLTVSQEEWMDALAVALRHRGKSIYQKWTGWLDSFGEAQLKPDELRRRLRQNLTVQIRAREASRLLDSLQSAWRRATQPVTAAPLTLADSMEQFSRKQTPSLTSEEAWQRDREIRSHDNPPSTEER